MKYLRQLLMILIFSFIGEVLHAVIPIQMPASIYGLVLLFIALMTGLVKLPILLPVIVLLLVSTVLVMGVSGQVTQQMMHHGKKEDKNE